MKYWPMEYALLRSILDRRPIWAINIGLHSILLNEEEVEVEFPRLKFKRRLGSHIVNPYADSNYVREQESKYEDYYKELLSRHTAMV